MKTSLESFDDMISKNNLKKKSKSVGFAVKNSTEIEELSNSKPSIKVVESTPEVEPKEEKPGVNIEALVNSLLAPHVKELSEVKASSEAVKAELSETKQALEAKEKEVEETKKALEAAKEAEAKLKDLEKFAGSQNIQSPQPLVINGEGSPAMRSYLNIVEKAETKVVNSGVGFVHQKDLRSANSFWKKNQKEISEGVEAILKDKGFLSGTASLNASTVVSDIPSVAFTHLSNFVRENTYQDLVFAQFFNRKAAPGVPPRLNTAIPNYPYQAPPTTLASRQLTPGTPIASTSSPVSERNVLITIEEWGLGKDTNAGNQPLGITSFVEAFSMADLEAIVMRNLGYDYQAYLDLRAYTHFFSTTTRYYPSSTGTLLTAPALLVDGQVSREFMINLFARLKADRTAAFSNNCYAYIHSPSSWAQYCVKLSQQERVIDDREFDRIGRLLKLENDGYGGVVSGYKGTHDGFMHFIQNSISVGAPGSIGVNNVTVETIATAFESSFAIGADTIALAEALPVEIRQSEITGYQRDKSFIWYAHCGTAEMNVVANSTTGTERRVVEIRNKRTI